MASLAEAIRITALGQESAELLTALHRESFPPGTGERWRPEDMTAILKLPETRCFLAERAESPVGYALARLTGEECELLSLGVLAPARRGGIGSALLQHVIAACRSAGAQRPMLEVRADNTLAQRFYTAHGFNKVGRRSEYYRGSDGWTMDAITMARDFDKVLP